MAITEKAVRGQIAALETTRSYTARDYKTVEYLEWYLVQILGVGRDGRIIRYRRLGDSFEYKCTPAKSLLIPHGKIDEHALVGDMERRVKLHWDANAFKSLDELKDYVSAFKREVA